MLQRLRLQHDHERIVAVGHPPRVQQVPNLIRQFIVGRIHNLHQSFELAPHGVLLYGRKRGRVRSRGTHQEVENMVVKLESVYYAVHHRLLLVEFIAALKPLLTFLRRLQKRREP